MQGIEALALFPLSDVVLLPQLSVPLYIFEPRYRQMTRDALASSRQIGMVAVRPDAVADMRGDPPIFDVGCVGRIAHAEQRPDGTFQILLVGEHRFRIREEHPREGDRLYRSAHVDLLEDAEPVSEEDLARLDVTRVHVLDVLTRIVNRARPDTSSEQLAGFANLEPTRLINALAQSISLDPIERQQLLEADSILTRFEIMGDLLRFRLAGAQLTGAPSGSLPN
jgi:Lon protease-like protein